jgi:hypothetical protein
VLALVLKMAILETETETETGTGTGEEIGMKCGIYAPSLVRALAPAIEAETGTGAGAGAMMKGTAARIRAWTEETGDIDTEMVIEIGSGSGSVKASVPGAVI